MSKLKVHIIIGLLLLTVLSSCRKYEEGFLFTDLSLSTSQDFMDARLAPDGTVFVAGGEKYVIGTMLQSGDEGFTWIDPDSINARMFYALDFVNEEVGFGSCGNGKLMKTMDGGQSWVYIQVHTEEWGWQPLKGMDFISETTGFLVGGTNTSQGFIYRSTNGGWDWAYQRFEHELRDVEIVNELTGFACGFGIIYKTEDAGLSWEPLAQSGDFYKAMSFPSQTVGYIVGDEGSIIKTTDAGASWEVQRKPNKAVSRRLHFDDVLFANEQLGYIVGEGIMLVTENGGDDWREVKDVPNYDYKGITLIDDRTGIIVGKNGALVRFEW